VEKYRKDFQGVLQDLEIEPNDLIQPSKLKIFLKELKHDSLIGTVLGFGRDNAYLFSQYIDADPETRFLTTAWPEEEIKHLEQLNEKILPMKPWEISDLFFPRFVCDLDSEETKQLQRLYREEKERIIGYYQGKDPVEATLSLILNL
jgi:hypothetical protein